MPLAENPKPSGVKMENQFRLTTYYTVVGFVYSFRSVMMTCTLDLYTDYLLSSTGPATTTGLSRLLDGGLSHDHVIRWLRQTTYGPADT